MPYLECQAVPNKCFQFLIPGRAGGGCAAALMAPRLPARAPSTAPTNKCLLKLARCFSLSLLPQAELLNVLPARLIHSPAGPELGR